MATIYPHGYQQAAGSGQLNMPVPATGLPAAGESLSYVARQAILDARGNVHGYELLFREGRANAFSGDGDAATRSVLDNTVVFGLEHLAGNVPVFVNCTRESILGGWVKVLPAQQTVLELLETLKPTADLLAACHGLKALGYRLALDDFEWKPEWEPFLPLVDYVKVDLSTTTAASRAALIRHLRANLLTHPVTCTVQLLAERVETQEDLELARREGFTLFQGYFFCRPVVLEQRKVPANQLVQLELLKIVYNDPLDIRRISDLVKRDASLTYRLLRVVNSPLYGIRKAITSIHGAVVMIGDEMFRRVATLAIVSELRGRQTSELLRMAFVRGRFCELAAPGMGQDPTEQYLLGILSLLPAMLGVSMENVAASLPFRPELHRALLGEHNAQRAILDWLLCYEQTQWDECDRLAEASGLSPATLVAFYAEAALWAEMNFSLAG